MALFAAFDEGGRGKREVCRDTGAWEIVLERGNSSRPAGPEQNRMMPGLMAVGIDAAPNEEL